MYNYIIYLLIYNKKFVNLKFYIIYYMINYKI